MHKPEATVDKRRFTLLAAVAHAAEALGIPWMVTGAGGRILLLEEVYGLPPGRATMDLDFGVMVESWDQYRRLETAICTDPQFATDPRQRQRLRHANGACLDLIPFGGVESPEGEIHWPPDRNVELDVTGFRDACRGAQTLLVNEALPVPVVSPEGLVVLKFVAWKARHRTHPRKDAADIAYVLRHYREVIGDDVLFDAHLGVVEEADYDLEIAAARVMGRNIVRLCEDVTRLRIQGLVAAELDAGDDSELLREVAGSLVPRSRTRAEALLRALRRGLEDPASEKEGGREQKT